MKLKELISVVNSYTVITIKRINFNDVAYTGPAHSTPETLNNAIVQYIGASEKGEMFVQIRDC